MNEILICLIITVSIVLIWDYFGFIGEFSNYMVELFTRGKIKSIELRKPFGCSLCMSVWITLIILLCLNWKLAPMALVFGWYSQYVIPIIQCIDMMLNKMLYYLQKILK